MVLPSTNHSQFLSAVASGFVKRGGRKRSEAEFRLLLFKLKKNHRSRAYPLFDRGISNLLPKVRLRSKKKAGLVYRVPAPLRPGQALSFATKWFRSAVKARSGRSFGDRLFRELVDAAASRGEAYKKKASTHHTALLNRGFTKFLK